MRIAIVGSGIAGLAAAWLLGRRHDVTLFERHQRPGMGAFNLDYPGTVQPARIDVPLRAFNASYYTSLIPLYRAAGVELERTDHAAGFTAADGTTYFRYRNLRFPGGVTVPMLAGLHRLGTRYLAIARDAMRFLLRARNDLLNGSTDDLTIEEYLRQRGYSSAFANYMLLPAFASICTCSYAAVRAYPASIIIDFFTAGRFAGGLWRARHGADDAIQQLLKNCATLHCSTGIDSIRRDATGVTLRREDGTECRFDHVIVAAQANQAAGLVATGEAEAADLLRRIRYERSEVVVHGDTALMPSQRRDWAPVNFFVDPGKTAPMANIWLNQIYPGLQGDPPLLQTWNPLREPAANAVLGRAHFERPVVDHASLAAIHTLQRLHRQPGRRIWYCGSYAMPGIPLLESAVRSAMDVTRTLGVDIPWQAAA